MTYEEAKEYILQNYFDGDEDVTASSGDEEIEAMKCAVGALDKQTRKKPSKKQVLSEDVAIGVCPVCGEGANYDMDYCCKCGQRIDWSEYDKS